MPGGVIFPMHVSSLFPILSCVSFLVPPLLMRDSMSQNNRERPSDLDPSSGTPGERPAPRSSYERPCVTPLGTLPASTGMPVSPLTLPPEPSR